MMGVEYCGFQHTRHLKRKSKKKNKRGPYQRYYYISRKKKSKMMGSVCAEQQHHKFHHSHQLYPTKKSLRDIDIPPRKLLGRRSSAAAGDNVYADSPRAEDAVFSKFLPYNNVDGDSDDSDDPYSSDQFRIYEFKVRKCNRSRSHDWTDCPFAHPGEKARRRDPRRYRYSGTVCSEFRKGHCGKGDNCEFSHGVFECWLHPSRYRTEACKDGKNCKRKVCFFAHSTRQLRIVPDTSSPNSSPPPPSMMDSPSAMVDKRYRNYQNMNCCAFCHSVTTASPTSTLMAGMSHVSPPVSPPMSPACSPEFYSRFCGGGGGESYGMPEFGGGGLSYKDAILSELMASVEAMNMNEAASSHAAKRNLPWLDVNFNAEEQPQFVLSPSTPANLSGGGQSLGHSKFLSGDGKFYNGDFSGRNLMEDSRYNNNNNSNEGNFSGPDLGWVNDLLT